MRARDLCGRTVAVEVRCNGVSSVDCALEHLLASQAPWHAAGKSNTCTSGFCTTMSSHCMSVPQPRWATGTVSTVSSATASSALLTLVFVAVVVGVRAFRLKVPQRAQHIGEGVHVALRGVSARVHNVCARTYASIGRVDVDHIVGLRDGNVGPAQTTRATARDVVVDLTKSVDRSQSVLYRCIVRTLLFLNMALQLTPLGSFAH